MFLSVAPFSKDMLIISCFVGIALSYQKYSRDGYERTLLWKSRNLGKPSYMFATLSQLNK
jgi:hypothetical protein